MTNEASKTSFPLVFLDKLVNTEAKLHFANTSENTTKRQL